ncbi:unnamed protein product [Urochloa humidicola]
MGRKGGLASIFSSKPKHADTPSAPWAWPSCAASPQTASFRRHPAGRHVDDDRWPCTTAGLHHRSSEPAAGVRLRPPRKAEVAGGGDDMYKTVNSVYFDAADDDSLRFFFFDDDGGGEEALAADDDLDDDGSCFSTTTASEEWSEAVIRSLGRTSTDRFFFDAGPATPAPAASNSILAGSTSPSLISTPPTRSSPLPPPPPHGAPNKKLQPLSSPAPAPILSDDLPESDSEEHDVDSDDPETAASTSLVEESVAVALDSEDPFGDFRASMAEMVSAHGLRGWPDLQEMLLWYLRINGKHNHALIVGAFVDLLVALATNSAGGSASATAATTTTTTATTMTTTTATTSACSSSSSTSSAGSSAGDVGTASAGAAAAAAMSVEEQCGDGSAGASCSSAASSDLELEEEDKSSDDNGHCASSGAHDSPCS